MDIPKFDDWCARGTKLIRYPGDRKRVARELRGHLEDHYEDCMARGMVHWKAVAHALEAMGEPEELAPMLARIHRPYWGYLMEVSRVLALCLLLTILIPIREIRANSAPVVVAMLDRFETEEDASGARRSMYLQPRVSVTDGDYTLTVTDAAEWCETVYSFPRQREEYTLYLRLELYHPDPDQLHLTSTARWFWAEDNLGNRYACDAELADTDIPQLSVNARQADAHTSVWVVKFEPYTSHGAQWIELHYDRGGRDHVLRIDLTGGETP